jgi:N-acetylglucosaminyl-diphospho-decaprenol L-rhamnosyltransferase
MDPDGNSPPLVTVSVVVHRQGALVQPLLRDLAQWCPGVIDRIVLTVNVPDPGLEMEYGQLPIVRIDNEVPRGFGANHNQAFRHCRTPWFLVINPDIRLDRDAITALLRHPGAAVGLLAPRVQEPGKPDVEPYRRLPTPWELLARRLPNHRPPASPDWVAGMFMLLRRDAFAAVQGFDDRYFMYCEDVDLCVRLPLHGWQVMSIPDVVVRHEAQRASQSSVRPLLWHLASLGRLWTSAAFWRYERKLWRRARAAASS